jgi:hypothetical protein
VETVLSEHKTDFCSKEQMTDGKNPRALTLLGNAFSKNAKSLSKVKLQLQTDYMLLNQREEVEYLFDQADQRFRAARSVKQEIVKKEKEQENGGNNNCGGGAGGGLRLSAGYPRPERTNIDPALIFIEWGKHLLRYATYQQEQKNLENAYSSFEVSCNMFMEALHFIQSQMDLSSSDRRLQQRCMSLWAAGIEGLSYLRPSSPRLKDIIETYLKTFLTTTQEVEIRIKKGEKVSEEEMSLRPLIALALSKVSERTKTGNLFLVIFFL